VTAPPSTRSELAALVTEALARAKIDVLLVGGSVVSIYSSDRYVTHDLDFVSHATLKEVRAALEPLGFVFVGRQASHPQSAFSLDFVAPPASVGSKAIVARTSHSTPHGRFESLTATDCVLDRLASFYFWNDDQALEQAILVAKANQVDLDEVRRWTHAEGSAVGDEQRYKPKLDQFVSRLSREH